MSFPIEQYPYTNFHDTNLDWILTRTIALCNEWKEYREAFQSTSLPISGGNMTGNINIGG